MCDSEGKCIMGNLARVRDNDMIEPRIEIIGSQTFMQAAPPVNHNRVVGNIVYMFKNFLRGKRCEAFSDGVDVFFDEENTFRPDAMIVCRRDIIKRDGIYGAPDLVVEVLSRSTAKRDRNEKKTVYEKYGVKEYWLVNYIDQTVEVYLLQDGKLELDNVYAVFPEWEWNTLTDEEKTRQRLTFKVSLYDNFVVDIRDIFERVDRGDALP